MRESNAPSRLRGLDWVTAALAAAVGPHVLHLPAWVTLLLLAVCAWRWTADLRGWRLAPLPAPRRRGAGVDRRDFRHVPHAERHRGRDGLPRADGGREAARDAHFPRPHRHRLHQLVPALRRAAAGTVAVATALAARQRVPHGGRAHARARLFGAGAGTPHRATHAAAVAAGGAARGCCCSCFFRGCPGRSGASIRAARPGRVSTTR